ncbi:unnamed protein product [Orchesella dallaii]|uniref:MACPF domain-containing protein n=1 Tax=Orchesella dallaii TaxID=48710 RepID=A0ABP1RCA2_9HEXA
MRHINIGIFLELLLISIHTTTGSFQTSGNHLKSLENGDYETDNDNLGDPMMMPIIHMEASITIVVIGRSGSGVSSTIRELVGPLTKCQLPDGQQESHKNIMEYTISNIHSAHNYSIKLVYVPRLVDDRSLANDSQILASLKSYLHQNGFPDFFLAVSRFDDQRFNTGNSLFTRFTKTIELFQKIYSGNRMPQNTVFLLTSLMSETRGVQKNPERKINSFRQVIQSHTSFPSPVSVIVGENNAETDFGARIDDDGYYVLPNKELYPKNIWKAFLNISTSSTKQDILSTMMNSRKKQLECETRLISTDWENFDEDANDYLYLLQQKNITVEENEVNTKIQEAFEKDNTPEKMFQYLVQKLGLQLRLQNMKITKLQDFPRGASQLASFFQNPTNRFSSGVSNTLLNQAFRLKIPDYVKTLNVGFGYDLLKDEPIPTQTPFRKDYLRESHGVGYQLPNFLECRKLSEVDKTHVYKSFSQSYAEYTRERLQYLDFPGKENMTMMSNKFSGRVLPGFNGKMIYDDDNKFENENVMSLSAVQEIRVLKCVLNTEAAIPNDEFLQGISSLTKFEGSDRDSVNEWNIFFNKFGSHIVTESYGGGFLHGILVGKNVTKLLELAERKGVIMDVVDEVLNSIVKFTNFSTAFNLGSPFYRYKGGTPNHRMEHLYDLKKGLRETLLNEWVESLNSDFVMLNYDLVLEPISTFARKYDKEKGELVHNALELLLRGELKYSRRRRTNNTTNSTKLEMNRKQKSTTSKPEQTTTHVQDHSNNSSDDITEAYINAILNQGNYHNYDVNRMRQFQQTLIDAGILKAFNEMMNEIIRVHQMQQNRERIGCEKILGRDYCRSCLGY